MYSLKLIPSKAITLDFKPCFHWLSATELTPKVDAFENQFSQVNCHLKTKWIIVSKCYSSIKFELPKQAFTLAFVGWPFHEKRKGG